MAAVLIRDSKALDKALRSTSVQYVAKIKALKNSLSIYCSSNWITDRDSLVMARAKFVGKFPKKNVSPKTHKLQNNAI